MPFLLATGVLNYTIKQSHLLQWLKLSVHRCLKHGPLRNSVLGVVIWKFVTNLLRDIPDKDALNSAFESLLRLKTYSDLEITRDLLQHVLPEVADHAELFLTAAKENTYFYPPRDIHFKDGSLIQTKTHLPLDLQVVGGNVSHHTGNCYSIETFNYNTYTPITILRPSTKEVTVTFSGIPVKSSRASAFGPGIVVRTSDSKPTTSTSFIGHVGLTLRGGRGTGRGPPSVERPPPRIMIDGSDRMELLCTVRFETDRYVLSTPFWSEPLVMDEAKPYCSIYCKGIRDISVKIEQRPVPPPVVPREVTIAEPLSKIVDTVTESVAAVRLSEMTPDVPRFSITNLVRTINDENARNKKQGNYLVSPIKL